MRRAACAVAALLLIAAGSPDWAGSAAGTYYGRTRNAGMMQCERTDFSVAGGVLQGRYHVEDEDPFDGILTGFVPDPPGDHPFSGTFTWIDRYGTGVQWISFAPDFQSFTGLWGDTRPLAINRSYGTRAGDPGCGAAVS